jgi:hypothetical protein
MVPALARTSSCGVLGSIRGKNFIDLFVVFLFYENETSHFYKPMFYKHICPKLEAIPTRLYRIL